MADIAVERGMRAQGIDWSAAVVAGLVGGIVFLMMEMVLMPLFGFAPSMWAPPRMIGAIGLGQEALPPPATFDLTIVMVAMVIHVMTSILFAVVVAFIIRDMTMGPAIGMGIVAALLLYGFVFYVMTAGPWPWFENGRNWVSILAHIVFGAIVAWWYKARAHPAEERSRV
jgi:uncharacterized membrane protein YagU involved in acid resistance